VETQDPKKKKKLSKEPPPVHTSKQDRTGLGFDLESFMEQEWQEWKAYQQELLLEVHQGNDDYATQMRGLAKFQKQCLTILAEKL